MTAAMILLHHFLKWHEQYPLPPRTITSRILGRVQRHTFISGEGEDSTRLKILTLASHFAYGGACGAAYSLIDRAVRVPRVITGPLFGLIVWVGSYLAWLPALGILSPATEHPPRRTALMIAAHLVWGVSVGLLLDRNLSRFTSFAVQHE